MRKLLFLLPFMVGLSLAKTPMSSMTAVFTVPAGAKTVVVEMDGETHVASLPGPLLSLPIRLVMTETGVRYAYTMQSGGNTSDTTGEIQVNLKYTPFPKKQVNFKPALNTWTSISTGEALQRWKITFGDGNGLRKESNALSLNVLFTNKPAEKVKDSLRPPQRP